MNLYRHPELYHALRSPDPDTLLLVRSLIAEHLGAPLTSLLDPACGPGTWLAPFASGRVLLAGNDLYEEMVQDARINLAEHPTEFTHGDMRQLRFTRGPFDVAMEVSGTSSHLETPAGLRELLEAMHGQVRSGGLVLLTVLMEHKWEPIVEPKTAWRSPPVALPSGATAHIEYRIIGREPPPGGSIEHIERIVEVARLNGVDGGPAVHIEHVRDQYGLRVWSASEITGVVAGLVGADVLGIASIDAADGASAGRGQLPALTGIHDGLQGEQILVIRKR
jgi:SAM-dependent methyltransferase